MQAILRALDSLAQSADARFSAIDKELADAKTERAAQTGLLNAIKAELVSQDEGESLRLDLGKPEPQ